MAEETVATTPSAPWHLWAVGIVGTLWNLVGAFDYVATQTQNESYMSQFTPEQLEFFYGFPTWVVAFWALAVWGGLGGTILILLRKRVAEHALLLSFVCMIVTSIHNLVLSDGLEVMGTPGLVFAGLIFLIALGLWLYARAMGQREVLT